MMENGEMARGGIGPESRNIYMGRVQEAPRSLSLVSAVCLQW